ncbi:hydratase [Candidatus Allofournierella excrementigallinarum]|uniref:hydratase n=1 Tax=Candidatus Allofournierella excrementigallinarum TaxID=2838592 RepID=UPI00374E860E
MVTCSKTGMYYARGQWVPADENAPAALAALGFDEAARQNARKGTIAWGILQAHNHSGDENALQLKFDALASHDITFVGIVQTARASGLTKFPMPYVLTNCHNSLCAVGGTINEDDHLFGLSAAKKYGGVYVPPHLAVIHQYMREMYAGCDRMILGSDSHTRYGALGTMAIGEGGGELAKQLLNRTYDVACPGVVAVHLTGAPVPGVGPQDVALAIIGAVFASGYVKNKVMEFVGPGVASLPLEYRSGIDVMTTETTCLSSIWVTDEVTRKYLAVHGREGDYKPLAPADLAYYDGVVEVALDKVRPMIALPMHPSNVYTIEELNANLEDILHKTEEDCAALVGGKVKLDLVSKIENGRLRVDQGVIAGCAGGTWSNICEAAQILEGFSGGNGEYALSVYPSSQPTMMALMKNGALASLMAGGATVRTAFCGPCFGAGDVPANGSLSIRHTTRNFPSREGSKPGSGQIAGVALMDARSIAATTRMGGILTPATDIDYEPHIPEYEFDDSSYRSRVYNGWGKANYDSLLRLGPNIKDWPAIQPLAGNLLLKVTSYITDPVTTTDELIPSGETSSYRSNPLGLAEFTLSRKDPGYVGRAKAVQAEEAGRAADKGSDALLAQVRAVPGCEALAWNDLAIASTIYAVKPGDGSAREQAASCQRVLGAGANIAVEYATKRYRSNLINWGMLPFQLEGPTPFGLGDYVLVPGVRALLEENRLENIPAFVLGENGPRAFTLSIAPLTADERQILLDGCLINYYKHG